METNYNAELNEEEKITKFMKLKWEENKDKEDYTLPNDK